MTDVIGTAIALISVIMLIIWASRPWPCSKCGCNRVKKFCANCGKPSGSIKT
jgi:hypothetical protein